MSAATPSRVVALSGGIGGAKLALGLSRVMAPSDLTLVANTGDDFEHLGLAISPDIDTLMYTLAGIENPETGWGRRDETWTFMQVLRELGGEDWFNLGDGDLAIHVERTRRLAAGAPRARQRVSKPERPPTWSTRPTAGPPASSCRRRPVSSAPPHRPANTKGMSFVPWAEKLSSLNQSTRV